MTLSEFLLARVAEDKRSAKVARGDFGQPYFPQDVSPTSAGRVLAECEAKRRIVAEYEASEFCERTALGEIVLILAAVYADHPDYHEEWRP